MNKRVIILISITLFTLVALLFTSCVDEITFDAQNVGRQLIVNGEITNGNRLHTVTISRTSDKGGIPIQVTGASVWIEDDIGNREQLIENYIEDLGSIFSPNTISGYTLVGDIVQGTMGHSYVLEITLEDGTTYRSKPDTMPTVLANDTTHFEIGTEQELSSGGIIQDITRAQVFLDSQLPSEPIYLKWDFEHVFVRITPGGLRDIICFVSTAPNPQGFVLFDGSQGVALNLENQQVGSRKINNDFFYISSLNVVQSSFSRVTFEYWERIKQVTANVGTIFDTPGATPIGNIFNVNNSQEHVLGHFSAVARDTSNIIVSRGDFPLDVVFNPCSFINFERNMESCANCLSIPNSTEKKPTYWPN